MASHWANSAMKMRMNRALLRRVDTVVSVSQTSRADFQRHYSVPESKTVYIPNGADVSRFTAAQDQGARNAARAELGLGPQAVAMLTAGSLTSEKNQTVLVPVLAELRKQGLDAHLLIAGAGPLMQGIEQSSAKLHVESALHVLGPVSDVPRVMAAADIFVLPSKTEGMPGVLIEAGMAGLPSVSFNVGGVAEVISDGQTGLLVAPDDLPGMVTAVSRLMRGPALRASMGAAAATKCRSQFDMREVAGQYEQLLIALTAQGRSVPVPGESRQSG
jgi:glycosyltransferase involved in cell wall biosynthesis